MYHILLVCVSLFCNFISLVSFSVISLSQWNCALVDQDGY